MKLKKNNPFLFAKSGISLRETFGKTLTKLSVKQKNIIVLDADLAGGTGLHHFRNKFPNRFIQCGIAEQNMVSVSGGLSMMGFVPIVTTFAVFMIRCVEQARLSIAYSNLNVKLVASHPGLDVGPDGASAQCFEDLACFRSLANFIVISPCDPVELEMATKEIIKIKGPVYMRTGRSNSKKFYKKSFGFKIGKGKILLKSKSYYIIGCGVTTHRALQAAKRLRKIGKDVGVINMSTIKPIDTKLLLSLAQKGIKKILTVEDHSIHGGLGSAVSEVLGSKKVEVFIKGVSQFGESGEPDDLAKKYNLDEDSIFNEMLKIIKK